MAFPYFYVLAVMSMTYYYDEDPGHVNLYISASGNTDILLEYPWSRDRISLSLDASNDYRWNVSYRMTISDRNSATASGIRIMSTEAITVQVSRGKISLTNVAAYTAVPLSTDSTEFYLSSRQNSSRGMTKAKPLFLIGTGTEAATVTLYKRRNDPTSVVYTDRVEARQMSEVYADRRMGNLTGYYLTATVPIALYSGHQCGNVPTSAVYCEPLLQQIPPLSVIGREYITGPISHRDRAGYTVRVVVTEDDTHVQYSGQSLGVQLLQAGAGAKCSLTSSEQTLDCLTPLQSGDYLDVQTSNASWPMTIHCSKKCYAYQFNHGGGLHNTGEVNTDPFMMVLMALDNVIEDDDSDTVHFSTVTSFSRRDVLVFRNYINIITRPGAGVSLDGTAIAGPERPGTPSVSSGDWIVYTVEVSHGFHEVRTTAGTPVLVQVYGHGPLRFNGQSAYGYPAAISVSNIETIVVSEKDLKGSSTTTSTTTTSTTVTTARPRPTATTTTTRLTTTTVTTTPSETTTPTSLTTSTTTQKPASTTTQKPANTRSTAFSSSASESSVITNGNGDGGIVITCGDDDTGPWSWLRLDMYIALGVIGALLLIVFGQGIAICVIKRRNRRTHLTIPKRKENPYDVFPKLPQRPDEKSVMTRYTSLDIDKPPRYDNIVNQQRHCAMTSGNDTYDDVIPNIPITYDELSKNTSTYDVPKGVYDYI